MHGISTENKATNNASVCVKNSVVKWQKLSSMGKIGTFIIFTNAPGFWEFCRHGFNLALLIKYFSIMGIIVGIRFFINGKEKVGTGISISNTNDESMTLTTYYYVWFQKIASCTKVKAAFTFL